MPSHSQSQSTALAILSTIIWFIALPIYIYGIRQFLENQQHVMIQKRFPLLCLLIVLCSFIEGTQFVPFWWLQAHHLSFPDFSSPMAFVVYGLVNIRLTLVYRRWKSNRRLARHHQTKLSSTSNTNQLQTGDNHSNQLSSTKWCNDLRSGIQTIRNVPCMLIISVTTLGFCFFAGIQGDALPAIRPRLSQFFWLSQMLTGIVLILVVICKKVNDGLGCLKETCLNLALLVVITVLIPMSGAVPSVYVLMKLLMIILPYIQGMLPLYGGLYYVQKMRKTAHNPASNVQAISTGIAGVDDLEVVTTTTGGVEVAIGGDIDFKAPLDVFLSQPRNYMLLKAYLSYCWSVENLLFLQHASIINHIVLQLQQRQQQQQEEQGRADEVAQTAPPSAVTDEPQQNRNMYDVLSARVNAHEHVICTLLGFAYLTRMYHEYKQRLGMLAIGVSVGVGVGVSEEVHENVDSESNELQFEKLKPELVDIYRQIYREFIEHGAPNEVNISFQSRFVLERLFTSEDCVEHFQSFADFLAVFRDAMLEVYDLVMSMYQFRFREFVMKKGGESPTMDSGSAEVSSSSL